LDPATYKPDPIWEKAEEAWHSLGGSVDPELLQVVAALLAFNPRERMGLGQALTKLGTHGMGSDAQTLSHPCPSTLSLTETLIATFVPYAEPLHTRYTSFANTIDVLRYSSVGMMLISLASLVTGAFWFFGPLLVLPMASILQAYLRSNMGLRVLGITVTTARVEGLARTARVAACLLFGGLLIGHVVSARNYPTAPTDITGGKFATAIALALVATALLVGGNLSYPGHPSAGDLTFKSSYQRTQCLRISVTLALACVALLLSTHDVDADLYFAVSVSACLSAVFCVLRPLLLAQGVLDPLPSF
jgi:hypothetical protein